MAIASVEELPVEGQRVFVRADFNVPMTSDGKISDDTRIRATLPTLQHLLQKKARIILGSHLGRPKGSPMAKYSLEPVGACLAELLEREVLLTDEPVGNGARKIVADLREGQVVLLENLRFHPGEETNDDAFSRSLASYCDVYVNDAFGVNHRIHASVVGMVKKVAHKGAGFQLLHEIFVLNRLLAEPASPFLVILGGVKVADKIGVLESLLRRAQSILIGGAMANTFLAAQGISLGTSQVETSALPFARTFLKKTREHGLKLCLPRDLRVAPTLTARESIVVSVDAVTSEMMVLDIGPETEALFAAEIAGAQTIFWNGPMGAFERDPFAHGTTAIALAMAANDRALTVAGGGDTAAALKQAGVSNQLSHVSTGGGASLEFLQQKPLPGIVALQ